MAYESYAREAREAREPHTPVGLSPVSVSVFSLVPDLLFACSRLLEYAKIRTVLQSRLLPKENSNPPPEQPGSPNDGFLLNILKTLFRKSTFRFLEIHSYRRYKIYICSIILGQLESFRNYPGFSIIFQKIYESANFSDSSFHRIFEYENFRFPFSTKSSLI